MHHTGSKSNIFCHFSVKNDKNRAQNSQKMASRFSSWKKPCQNWALSVSFLTLSVPFMTPKCSFLTPYHAILTPFFHVGEAPFSCQTPLPHPATYPTTTPPLPLPHPCLYPPLPSINASAITSSICCSIILRSGLAPYSLLAPFFIKYKSAVSVSFNVIFLSSNFLFIKVKYFFDSKKINFKKFF